MNNEGVPQLLRNRTPPRNRASLLALTADSTNTEVSGVRTSNQQQCSALATSTQAPHPRFPRIRAPSNSRPQSTFSSTRACPRLIRPCTETGPTERRTRRRVLDDDENIKVKVKGVSLGAPRSGSPSVASSPPPSLSTFEFLFGREESVPITHDAEVQTVTISQENEVQASVTSRDRYAQTERRVLEAAAQPSM